MQVKSWLTPFSLTPHRSKKVRATWNYFTDTSSHEGSNFAPKPASKQSVNRIKGGLRTATFHLCLAFTFLYTYIVVYIEEKKSPPEGWSRQRGMYHHSLEKKVFCLMKWPRKMLQNLCLFLEYKTQHIFSSFSASSFHIPKSSILLGHYIVNLPLISKECSSELGGKTLALLKLLLLHQPDTDNQKSSDVWIQWELNSCNASKKLLTELESHLRFFGKYLYRVPIR